MTLRRLITLAVLTIAAVLPCAASAKPGDVAEVPTEMTIVRVHHEWRDAASFKRIAEYFDGKEHNGSEALRRSHPEERSGYYFFVRIKNPGAVRPAKAALQVVTSTSAQPVSYQFPVELKAGATVFNIGLTGADWPDPDLHPVAWKLDFVGTDGTILATAASYLWEKPASK